MAQLIPGSELLGRGIDPFSDFSESRTVGVVCDTSANLKDIKVSDTITYQCAKSIDYQQNTTSDESTDFFSSREEYETSLKVKLGVEGKYGVFSGSFEHTFGSDFKSLSERTAVRKKYSSTLWTLRFNDDAAADKFKEAVRELPSEFDGTHPEAFYQFFRKFGTYVITEVTVGGSMDFAMLIDRSFSESESTAKTMISAEYGAMFKGSSSVEQMEKIKKEKIHRSAKLSLKGGDVARFNLPDVDNPSDHHTQFQEWVQSIPKAPQVVSMKLTAIDAFVPAEKKAAMLKAIEAYTGGTALVESNWIASTIVLKGNRTLSALSLGPAALRVVLVDTRTLTQEQHIFNAPDQNAADQAFADFWNGVLARLKDVNPKEKMLLLATERWPRDPRYFPSESGKEQLIKLGAQKATLDRWYASVQDIQRCPLAGVSYVLVGNDQSKVGVDAFAAGFGEPGRSLNPTASVLVLLPRNNDTRVSVIPADKPAEQANTELYAIETLTDSGLQVAVDQSDRRRLMMKKEDAAKPGAERAWYFYTAGERYGWKPYVIINYQTCGCIQGNYEEKETKLGPFPADFNLQDDILWDYRGDNSNFHMLMLHWHSRSLCQTRLGDRIAVRPWHQNGMEWKRIKLASR